MVISVHDVVCDLCKNAVFSVFLCGFSTYAAELAASVWAGRIAMT